MLVIETPPVQSDRGVVKINAATSQKAFFVRKEVTVVQVDWRGVPACPLLQTEISLSRGISVGLKIDDTLQGSFVTKIFDLGPAIIAETQSRSRYLIYPK
jgi:hypothetical protein